MSDLQEKTLLEKNLSLVMGRPIDLRSPEIRLINSSSLKHAYYRRAHEFHPDKAASLGLDPDYLAGRFRSLQDAYSLVVESLDSGSFASLLKESEPSKPSWTTSHVPFSAAAGFRTRTQTHTQSQTRTQPYTQPHTQTYTQTAWKDKSEQAFRTPSAPRPGVGMYHSGDVPSCRLRLAQYLFYTRRIDWATLIQALSWQYCNRPKVGELGIELGYMENADVLHVLGRKKMDELFGEAAVRLGRLSPQRLSILVGRQRLLNLPIGRYFVENGFIDSVSLAACLDSLYKHNFYVKTPSMRLDSGR